MTVPIELDPNDVSGVRAPRLGGRRVGPGGGTATSAFCHALSQRLVASNFVDRKIVEHLAD